MSKDGASESTAEGVQQLCHPYDEDFVKQMRIGALEGKSKHSYNPSEYIHLYI